MSRWSPARGVALALTLAASTAAAQGEPDAPSDSAGLSTEDQARELVREGVALFEQDRWGEAVEVFREAEKTLRGGALDVPPLVFFAIARCYDQLGQISAASGYYARFLGVADPEDERQASAIQRATQAKKRLKSQLDHTALRFRVKPDGVQVRIDRRTVGVTPLDPVKVTPGPHQVTFWAKGYAPASVDVNVAAGATAPVVVTLVPRREPERPREEPAVEARPEPRPASTGPPRRARTSVHWWVGAATAAVVVGATAAALLWPAETLPDRHVVRLSVRSR